MSTIRELSYDIEMKVHEVNVLLQAIIEKLDCVENTGGENSRNAVDAISCFASLAQRTGADLFELNQRVLSGDEEVVA